MLDRTPGTTRRINLLKVEGPQINFRGCGDREGVGARDGRLQLTSPLDREVVCVYRRAWRALSSAEVYGRISARQDRRPRKGICQRIGSLGVIVVILRLQPGAGRDVGMGRLDHNDGSIGNIQ